MLKLFFSNTTISILLVAVFFLIGTTTVSGQNYQSTDPCSEDYIPAAFDKNSYLPPLWVLASAAEAVYKDIGCDIVLTDAGLEVLKSLDSMEDGEDGFAAQAYSYDDYTIISYRGTEPSFGSEEFFTDFIADVGMVFNDDPSQHLASTFRGYIDRLLSWRDIYSLGFDITVSLAQATVGKYPRSRLNSQITQAYDFYNRVVSQCRNTEKIVITGHSLGGFLAQMVAARVRKNAYTFNAPGAANYYLEEFEIENRPETIDWIYNFKFDSDLVSKKGYHIGNVTEYEWCDQWLRFDIGSSHSITHFNNLLSKWSGEGPCTLDYKPFGFDENDKKHNQLYLRTLAAAALVSQQTETDRETLFKNNIEPLSETNQSLGRNCSAQSIRHTASNSIFVTFFGGWRYGEQVNRSAQRESSPNQMIINDIISQAWEYLLQIRNTNQDASIVLVGYGFGGFLAQILGMNTGFETYTFNTPSASYYDIPTLSPRLNTNNQYHYIYNYIYSDDIEGSLVNYPGTLRIYRKCSVQDNAKRYSYEQMQEMYDDIERWSGEIIEIDQNDNSEEEDERQPIDLTTMFDDMDYINTPEVPDETPTLLYHQDRETQLIWEVKTETNKLENYTWQEAVDYCQNLTYSGYSHWRLPTTEELLTLRDTTRDRAPYINTNFFPLCQSDSYWTSTPIFTELGILCVDFGEGRQYIDGYRYRGKVEDKRYNNYVRCVHDNSPDSNDSIMSIEGMVFIPGGTFQMGSDDGYRDEKTIHTVRLSAFYLDETEVTTAAFEQYLRKNNVSSDWYSRYVNDSDDGYRFCNIGSGRFQHPVNCVSWFGASDYCSHLGKRLPTESEWEYAAGGGSTHATWSLGNSFVSRDYCCNRWEDRLGTCPVGSYASNDFGLYDMTGNVSEWCNDWYGDYGSDTGVNPSGPVSGSNRVFRGGSWDNGREDDLRVSNRYATDPSNWFISGGFRCAMSVTP